MSTSTPYVAHYDTAKMHLAGIKAAQVWHQELAAAHLLRIQEPIRSLPIEDGSAKAEQ